MSKAIEVATLGNGCHLFRQRNEVGGYIYTSDEIGCGVTVWDTALVDVETILTAIADHMKLQRVEYYKRQQALRELTEQAQELDMGYNDMVEPSNSERGEWPDTTRVYVEQLEEQVTSLEHRIKELKQLGEWIGQKELDRIHKGQLQEKIAFLQRSLDTAKFQARDRRTEISRLTQWINDLQSGQYTTCIYCGHRYGPTTEISASKSQILKEHIEQCPLHPMSKLRSAFRQHLVSYGGESYADDILGTIDND